MKLFVAILFVIVASSVDALTDRDIAYRQFVAENYPAAYTCVANRLEAVETSVGRRMADYISERTQFYTLNYDEFISSVVRVGMTRGSVEPEDAEELYLDLINCVVY